MNSIISTDIFTTLAERNSKEELKSILELMDELTEHGFSKRKNNKIWEFQVDDNYFYEWLYDKNPPELVELKREFYQGIDKATDISIEEYDEFESILKKQRSNNSDYHDYLNQFLFIKNDTADEIHIVSSITKFYRLRRWYLEKCLDKKNFVEALPLLFPNLYFHQNILSTLRTLNNEFSIILPEIVQHLTALNLYFNIGNINYHESNIIKCKKFEEFSKINCTPESSRDKVEKLTFKSDLGEKINCECHTKFNTFGKEKEKQDRIYFSFGKDSYSDGKIIIYHIGDHI